MDQPKKRSRILVLDDVAAVRNLVIDFLREEGYEPYGVATSEELLRELGSHNDVAAVLLDLQLDGDRSIHEVHKQLEATFPGVLFPHEKVLDDLGADDDDAVSGRYLLPMIKAISPATKVIVLTGAWEGVDDNAFLEKWGAHIAVQKMAPDSAFQATKVPGLSRELLQRLDE